MKQTTKLTGWQFPKPGEDILPIAPRPDEPMPEYFARDGLPLAQQKALITMRYYYSSTRWQVDERYEHLANNSRAKLGERLLSLFYGESRGRLPLDGESRGGVESVIYETIAMGFRPVSPNRDEPLTDQEKELVHNGAESVVRLLHEGSRPPYDRVIQTMITQLFQECDAPILYTHDPVVTLCINALGFYRVSARHAEKTKTHIANLREAAEEKVRLKREREALVRAEARLASERAAWGRS